MCTCCLCCLLSPARVRARTLSGLTPPHTHTYARASQVIPAAVANDPVGERERASLHSELGVLFSARCDYVVALRGAFCFQGQIAIALECCDSSLSQIIKAKVCARRPVGFRRCHRRGWMGTQCACVRVCMCAASISLTHASIAVGRIHSRFMHVPLTPWE